MAQIRIKKFGPIKEGFKGVDDNGNETEFMDIKKVTVFIGNQGSGKSTVAKLISTMMWIEKALYRGDITEDEITGEDFVYENCAYHRIVDYLKSNTEIDYRGDIFDISYRKANALPHGEINISKKPVGKGFHMPKIMYVPAERNFLSTVEGADDVKGLPKPLYTFSEEFLRSKQELTGRIELPISKLEFEYDSPKNTSYIIGSDYRLNLLEASSGFQSAVPLFLVSQNLTQSIERLPDNSKVRVSLKQGLRMRREKEEVENDPTLSEAVKKDKIELIEAKYRNNCFVNIVEEPEQNLFPTSQKEMLESLLGFNNRNDGSMLIMATHSPYVINYITLFVESFKLNEKITVDGLRTKLRDVVSAIVDPKRLAIYQLNEELGTIEKLKDYKGLPSDENFLNQGLEASNILFSKLLEIEDQCQ